MYKIGENYVYRIINNKLVVLNLDIPDEVLIFNNKAREAFLSIIDGKIIDDSLNDFKNELLEKGIITR